MSASPARSRAILMLAVTTAAWGFSFPAGKAIMLAMDEALPGRGSWFFSSLMIGARFGLGAVLLLLAYPRTFGQLTTNEWRQGIGLGVFGGLGMLIQADGLVHTAASTSAFLTQFTAVLVPLAVAFRDRQLPSLRTSFAVLLVMIGVAILGQFDFAALHFGRGELETLVATGFLTCLILWLERPLFRGNHSGRVSIVMFATIALVLAPVILAHSHRATDVVVIVQSGPVAMVFLALTLICSVFAFAMMNYWQPKVDATTAGVVYCTEPLFATLFALVLPAWLARYVGVDYANESFSTHLLVGGGLITAANVIIAAQPAPAKSA